MDGISPLALALLGTGFTFFMTAAGAAMVFFFRKEVSADQQRLFLGFAAGIMVVCCPISMPIAISQRGCPAP